MGTFDRIHDVVIFGAGHAGFAAVRALRAQGVDALLLDAGPALLWEAGWAFADDLAGCADPAWTTWCGRLAARGLAAEGRVDGGGVEAEAAALLAEEGVPALLYAVPYAVELAGDRLAAVALATKGGPRRLAARRWIDASDDGALARLAGAAALPAPSRQRLHIVLRRAAWDLAPIEVACPELPAASVAVETTRWANERRLAVELPGQCRADHALWLPVLRAAHTALGTALSQSVVTHGSVQTLPRWDAAAVARGLPANLALATPAVSGGGWTLGGRFALGLAAAAAVRDLPAAVPAARGEPPAPTAALTADADLAVIGAGTGGAIAALAGARAGLRTIACDPLPFVGGIGSGGGIHAYFWGVRGGLQEEVDERVRAAMPLFSAPGQVAGFHAEAKRSVLAAMLAEAGVDVRYGLQLASVELTGRRIATCLMAGVGGVLRLNARTWIDGTGDGDLCAQAGATFAKGRAGDGLLHAYTQSSGRAGPTKEGLPRVGSVNFDAGYCDPTDPEDLSRARIVGCALLAQERYEADARPCGVSPAIGLRQGRHIACEATVTLDDHIVGRRFPDAIGATGSNYDNHARDYEFESMSAAFWVWACRSWRTRLWCEIPYGCIVPKDLDNCWISSRCLGVTEEAHHSLRMMRDMQRIGEAAALAAAAALAQERPARAIDLTPVRAALQASGAFTYAAEDRPDAFGIERGRIDDAAATDLGGEESGLAMWQHYRRGEAAVPELLPLLSDPRAAVSWRAAAILGALGEVRAEPRLLAALAAREDLPAEGRNFVPLWLAGLAMLRACATPAALPALDALLAGTDPGFHVRALIVQAVTAIARRHTLNATQRAAALAIVARAEAMQTAPTIRDPNAAIDAPPPAERKPTDRRAVRVDATWQLRQELNRARAALASLAAASA